MNRSRYASPIRLCRAAYTAKGIRTPALFPLGGRSLGTPRLLVQVQSPRLPDEYRIPVHDGTQAALGAVSEPHGNAPRRICGAQLRRNIDAPRPEKQTQAVV
jgi:hypothetical protein